jgi:hypothetical protein
MGKDMWMSPPLNLDWSWLFGQSDCPWYLMERLFGQSGIGDLQSLIAMVSKELLQHCTDRNIPITEACDDR